MSVTDNDKHSDGTEFGSDTEKSGENGKTPVEKAPAGNGTGKGDHVLEAPAEATVTEIVDSSLTADDDDIDDIEYQSTEDGAVYKGKLKRSLLVFGGVFVVLLAIVFGYLYISVLNTDNFLKGTTIGGIDVSGMSRTQAATALTTALKARNNKQVIFFKDKYQEDVTLENLAEPVDVEALVESALKTEKSRNWQSKLETVTGGQHASYDIAIVVKESIKEKYAQEWNAKWAQPAVDAGLDLNDAGELVIMDEKSGIKVDIDGTFAQLQGILTANGTMRCEIKVIADLPKITAKDLEGMHELNKYTTEYDTGLENRSNNLELAAATIDKTKVDPGQVFSFNNTVGERTAEAGYRDALIYVGNQVEPGLGGGVCQVASTLYNAVLLSGMEIVERHNHNLPVTYVPLGLDATVNWGSMDFQFRNNTNYPVYIACKAGGGSITISIFGKGDKPHIELGHETTGTIGSGTVQKYDPTLPPGTTKVDKSGSCGYTACAWRIFYDDKGNVVKREDLGSDTYAATDTIVLVGPAGVPGNPSIPGSPVTPETPGNTDNTDPLGPPQSDNPNNSDTGDNDNQSSSPSDNGDNESDHETPGTSRN